MLLAYAESSACGLIGSTRCGLSESQACQGDTPLRTGNYIRLRAAASPMPISQEVQGDHPLQGPVASDKSVPQRSERMQRDEC